MNIQAKHWALRWVGFSYRLEQAVCVNTVYWSICLRSSSGVLSWGSCNDVWCMLDGQISLYTKHHRGNKSEETSGSSNTQKNILNCSTQSQRYWRRRNDNIKILKWSFVDWINLAQDRTVSICSEHNNKPSGPTKRRGILWLTERLWIVKNYLQCTSLIFLYCKLTNYIPHPL
jgi:hypothetical protein